MPIDQVMVTGLFFADSQGSTNVAPERPIVLLGCGHSGSVNLLEQISVAH